jgi:gamma-glutamylcyclotransferase (GGCT)/AIG2-like uncharacterized protein YtfP
MFTDKIFVYGTLKSDGPFYVMFKKYVIEVKQAYTYGSLYIYKKLFPAFNSKGKNKVYGELMTLMDTRAAFKILDAMETYYKKTIIDVYIEGQDEPVKSWVYHVNKNLGEMKLIKSGFWDNSIDLHTNRY